MRTSFVSLLGGIPLALAKVEFMGVNIAGFDFGCQIDGTCPLSSISPPLTSLGGADGAGQMQHFVSDDQMNIFRLPVSWQFLVNNQLGGALDSTNFGKYDQLMQACLSTGAYCAIDIHNFARFNGQIIGQSSGGPTDAQFADLWSQLATKYKVNTKVVFGLMNEPHDVDITAWANSVQAAVTAIRNAGATTQMILLPGNNFTSAATFVSNGSAVALSNVTNPDGSTTGLILDVHKYLDVDNSGEHVECTTDNIADAFQLVANFLRKNGRQAIVSETGAGSTASCFTNFCAQNMFLNQNSDVFLGYIAWAAGSFSTTYVLSLTPTKENGKLVDNQLASKCVVAPWLNASNTATFVSSALTSTRAGSSAGTVAATESGVGPSTSLAESTLLATTTGEKNTIQTSSSLASSASLNSAGASVVGNGTVIANATIPGSVVSQTPAPEQATGGAVAPKIVGNFLAGGLLVAAFL